MILACEASHSLAPVCWLAGVPAHPPFLALHGTSSLHKTLSAVWRVCEIIFSPSPQQPLSIALVFLLQSHFLMNDGGSNTAPGTRCRVCSHPLKSFDFLSTLLFPHLVQPTYAPKKAPTPTVGRGCLSAEPGSSAEGLTAPRTPQLSPGTWAEAEDAEIYRENTLGCFIKQ